MPETQLPQPVSDLLQPISKQAPTGEDIANSDDPVASAAYTDLEMEITRTGEVNYQKTVQMAVEILSKRSKHLRVAAWLCLSWYRVEGAAGFKNGLLLILNLLKTFSDKLFPEKKLHRSKAIQFLNLDKRFSTIPKSNTLTPGLVKDIQDTLKEIESECRRQLPEAIPDFSRIFALMKNPETIPETGAAEKTPAAGNDKIETDLTKKDEPAEPAVSESAPAQEESPNNLAMKSEETQSGVEEKPIELSPEVADLLEDISKENPAGDNIEDSGDQDAQVIYMNLSSEIKKYSDNNYPQCLKWAQEILKNRSKHLRVAVWLLIAWFRVENLAGLKNGIQLILELLKKYDGKVHPQDNKQKSLILQSLNTETRLKLIQKIKVEPQNSRDIIEIGELFTQLVEQANVSFSDIPPKLTVLADMIGDKVQDTKSFLERDKKEVLPEDKTEQGSLDRAQTQPAQRSDTGAKHASAQMQGAEITDDKSAKTAIKTALQFYFRTENVDPPLRKIADDALIYALGRTFRWWKLSTPVQKDQVTQLEGPNEPKQNHVTKLYKEKDWDTLIPELEINFLSNDNFVFWLDVHFYEVKAMEQKGGDLDKAVLAIKEQLALFVSRHPGITNFMFKDGKTPFANKDTKDWIDAEVMNTLRGGGSQEKILPPIMGEIYDEINKIYQAACESLPANFTDNLKSMQQAIEGENRKKGKFLRLINLANYCYLAKKYSLAQPLFEQLLQQIEEYHISAWETALCVAVWQSNYINIEKLLKGEKDDQKKTTYKHQQKQMFDKIVKYDAALALTLENYIKDEGE